MKIVDIKSYALTAHLDEPFYYAEGWIRDRYALIVEVVTDEGISGFGEAMCHGTQPPEMSQAVIDHLLKPIVIGQDPFDAGVLWDRMYHAVQPFSRRGLGVNAISGIDVALWDCMGKAVQRPVSKLLGGRYRESVRPYATGFFRVPGGVYPQDAADEARRHIANGYTAMKVKIGYGLEDDSRVVRAVREAAGPDALIMVDGNCAYSAGTARRLMPVLEECNIHWFEEPLAPDDRAGYELLRSQGTVSIAMGETEFSPMGFREWIEHRSVDIIQPDVCVAGGFTACRKIADMAHCARMQVVPHLWGSGVAFAASLQFLATIAHTPTTLAPLEPLLEYDQSAHPFRQELIGGMINRDASGMVHIPDAPGLGITINRDVLAAFQR